MVCESRIAIEMQRLWEAEADANFGASQGGKRPETSLETLYDERDTMQSLQQELEKASKVEEQCYETRPSAEDRESVLAVVERLHHEYRKMTREFQRVCRNQQLTYLTPIQVSARLGITRNTLVRWRKDGWGPRFVKRGGRIVYPSKKLELWLLTWRREQAGVGVREVNGH